MRQYYEDDEPRRYRGEGREEPYRGEHERGEAWRRGRGERGFIERAGDEVRSWFGDEDAQRRRERDEREMGYADREGWRGRTGARGWGERERGWGEHGGDERSWARQWGYVEGRREGRGPGEHGGWRDRDRVDRERGFGESERATSSAPFYGGGTAGGGYVPGYGRGSGYGTLGGPERYWSERREGGAWSDYPESAWHESPGRYVGRGPRGYQRSDERLRDEVCERLAQHGEIDASDMEVQVVNGEVTLSGTVATRREKRLAEDLAESVWGVREVHNQVRVKQGLGPMGQQPPPGSEPGEGWSSRAA